MLADNLCSNRCLSPNTHHTRASFRGLCGAASSTRPSTRCRVAAPEAPVILTRGEKAHTLTAERLELVKSLEPWAETHLLKYLRPSGVNWQPTDWLPDSTDSEFLDQIHELRAGAQDLPHDLLVVLVGDMVTEEALPTYMNMLNTLEGVRDETGASPSAWSRWNRAWTAEENRHGDLLSKYLYLSGRVDMRAVECTIQNLIAAGFDPKFESNPYLCFVYTSFQERATKISHGSTARLAAQHGDNLLSKICGVIAADEARHEVAYQAVMSQLFDKDPEGSLLAFANMMKKGILMPAHLMDDGRHAALNGGANLFVDFATAADALGVYTTADYADIVDHLVDRWGVAHLRVSGEAAAAQEYLCKHSSRIRRLASIQTERRLRERAARRSRSAFFSWVGNREVELV